MRAAHLTRSSSSKSNFAADKSVAANFLRWAVTAHDNQIELDANYDTFKDLGKRKLPSRGSAVALIYLAKEKR